MNLRERDRERESIYNNDIEREGESERERARQPWHRARYKESERETAKNAEVWRSMNFVAISLALV